MVGPLMLLKMLHCKRKKSLRIPLEVAEDDTKRLAGTSHGESSQERKFKKEYDEDHSVTACRVCLKEGDVPIYGDDKFDDISEALITFGGIEIQIDDVYPKYLCKSCHALLHGAILFRKTAQQTDSVLKQSPQDTNISDNEEDASDYEEDPMFHYKEDKVKQQKVDVYYCKKCDLYFDCFEKFQEHRLSQEHENKRQTCPICNNSYTSVYLKRHLSLHKMEAPHMCDICGKKFIIRGQFTRHRLTHFYSLPYKCSLCPYRGRFSESLKMHMRSHTGEKPYQCTQCPARFVNKSNLNKHILTHKGEHDFKCDSCGRGFYFKRDLDLHFKVDHTGIKDHVCNICGKAFGYRKQMMKHQLKVHKREKFRSGRTPLYIQAESNQQGSK